MEGYYTGRVSSVDAEKGFVKVTYPGHSDIVSERLPLLAFEYNTPKVGALVATVLDKFGNGVCLGEIFSNSQSPPINNGYEKDMDGVRITKQEKKFMIKFDDENYIEYDGENKKITIRADDVDIIRNK